MTQSLKQQMIYATGYENVDSNGYDDVSNFDGESDKSNMQKDTNHHNAGDSNSEQPLMDTFEQLEQPSRVVEEPDWNALSLNAPADKDVPVFLAARDRRRNAEQRLGAAIDNAFHDLKQFTDDILKCTADLYYSNKDILEDAETEIQQLLESNQATRVALQEKLEETKKASRAEIHRLLMKVGGR
jgi:hypothetical protein